LQGAGRALKSGGKFIFTVLNVLFPLFHNVKEFINESGCDVVSVHNNFYLMTFRDMSTIEITDDSGIAKHLHCNELYYVPSEISWLLKILI